MNRTAFRNVSCKVKTRAGLVLLPHDVYDAMAWPYACVNREKRFKTVSLSDRAVVPRGTAPRQ